MTDRNSTPLAGSGAEGSDKQGATSLEPLTPKTASVSIPRRVEARVMIALLALAVVYSLAVAQSFLIPVALAFLLGLVLAPLVRWLERAGLPRALGAGAIVLTFLGGLGYGLASALDPVNAWIEQAPRMLRQLERKIYPIKKTVEEVSKTAEQVDRITSVGPKPTVTVSRFSVNDVLYENARGLVTGLIMTMFLLYFFLSWGQAMWLKVARLIRHSRPRNKFLELSQVLENEVSRYLLTITMINLGLGCAVALMLFAFGVPDPLLWGAVVALMNFIPYVGGLVSAVLIGATALLTFDNLSVPGLVVAGFMLLTTLEGQVVTPLVLGQRLALNPLVVFLAVVFWFWLWGVAGALMAVPMLITLKLIGDRVTFLRPFAMVASR